MKMGYDYVIEILCLRIGRWEGNGKNSISTLIVLILYGKW